MEHATPPNPGGPRGGVVLCGGLSSRMGRPKALLPWRGRTMIEHVVGTLSDVVEEVVVVTSAELELPPLDAVVVEDREAKLGPLAGIREGLEASDAELCYVTSTDAPFLSPSFITDVLSFGRAAAPKIDGFVQTMAAAYPKKAASVAGDLLDAGQQRPLHLLEALDFREIEAHELCDLESLQGFNDSEQYLEALRRESCEETTTIELLGTAYRKAGVSAVHVPFGYLGDALENVQGRFPSLELCRDGALTPHYLFSLNGRSFVRERSLALGPGDRLIVMDAAAGG